MENLRCEENLITAITDLLRREHRKAPKSLFRILRSLKPIYGSLQEGLDYLELILAKDRSAKQPKLMSSVPEIIREEVKPRFKSFDFSRADNPMRNNVVLQNVFRFCSVRTLKVCCLVSKEWNALSSPSLRSKAFVYVKGKESEDRLQEVGNDHGNNLFERFRVFSYYGWTEKTRLKDIAPNMTYLDVTLGSYQRLQLQFIFSHFHQLRYLRFVVDLSFQRGFDQLEIKTPLLKLRTFKLYGTAHVVTGLEPLPEQSCHTIMKNVPNLEVLNVKFDLRTIPGDELNTQDRTAILNDSLKNILTAVKNVRITNDFSTLPLNELNISQPGKESVEASLPDTVELINAYALPLKRLMVDIGKGTTSSAIASLLEPHSNTLEYLRTILMLEMSMNEHGNPILLSNGEVKLPKLERIEIVSEAPTAFYFLGSLETIKLDTLIISQEKADIIPTYDVGRCFREFLKNTDVCCSERIPLPILESVHLPNLQRFQYWGRVYFNENELTAIAKAMPNLRHLQMNICANTFPVICKLWPRLWTLVLTSPNKTVPVITDYALTGLELGQSSSIERRPNITDLKELTDFTYLHYFDRVPSWELTCHSVKYGFTQLPRLHFLDVGFRKLSFDGRKALENYVPNLYVFCVEYFTSEWKMTTPGYFGCGITVKKQKPSTEGIPQHDKCSTAAKATTSS